MSKILLSFFIVLSIKISANEFELLPFFDSVAALKFIKKYLPDDPIIVEAGAFDGSETFSMSKLWPKGTIHAFEPVPDLFHILTYNTSGCNNVKRYMYALSDKIGVAKFNLSEDSEFPGIPTASGSLLEPKEHLKIHHYIFKNQILVKTITLNEWAEKNNIKNVDMLWLDTQGYELFALKKAQNILKTVKIIYIEMEFIEAYAGQPLYKDIKEWLEENGFKLIAQDALKYSEKHWCCNGIFIRKLIK